MKKIAKIICLLAIAAMFFSACSTKTSETSTLAPSVSPTPTQRPIRFSNQTSVPIEDPAAIKNNIVKILPSPNGEKIAYIFIKNKDKKDQTYQLSILDKDKKLNTKEANVYITENQFDVDWSGDQLLLVATVDKPVEHKKVTDIDGIMISYGQLQG